MKWAATLLILGFSVAVIAAETAERESLKSLEEVQSSLENMDPTPKSGYCPDCELELAKERAQCFEKICENSSQKAYEIEEKAKTAPDTAFEKEIANKFSRNFDLKWKFALKQAKARVKLLETPKKNWTETEKKQIALVFGVRNMVKLRSEKFPGGGVKLISRYNREESKKTFPEASDEEISFIHNVGEYILNDLMPDGNSAHFFPPEVFLKAKHADLNQEEAFQAEIKETEALYKEMLADPKARDLARAMAMDESQLEFSRDYYKDLQVPNSEQLTNLMVKKDSFRFLSQSAKGDSAFTKLAEQFKLEWVEKPESKAKILDQAKRDLKYLENASERKKAKALYESRCLAEVKYGINTLPSADENKKAIQAGAQLIQRIDKEILSRYSTHTQESVRPGLQKTHFVAPPTPEDFKKQQNSRMDQSILDTQRRDKMDKDNLVGDYLEKRPAKIVFENEAKDCVLERNFMISDASYGTTLSIEMGWGTVRDQTSGLTTSAHELGHRLAALFRIAGMSEESKAKHMGLLNCLVMANQDKNEVSLLGEDFADFIAAELMKDQPENAFCNYMNKDEILATPEQLSLFRSDPEDEHSSLFFRLIQMQRAKAAGLPNICRKVVRNQDPGLLDKPRCKLPEKTGTK